MAKFRSEPLPTNSPITEAIPVVLKSSFTTIDSIQCGSGSFGIVSMATHPDYNKVAIKIMKRNATSLDWAHYKREVQKMKKLNAYPQIIKVHCIIEETRCWGIVMEWMEHGDLQSFQKKLTDVPWPLCMKMLLEVVEGMYFLHHVEDPAIIHRDLKANNIFVNENLSIRIGDLGLSASTCSAAVAPKGGTPTHMPPEYFDMSEQPNLKWDVYSFAILTYEVFSGHDAYPALNGNVGRLKDLVLYADQRPALNELSCNWPQSVIDLMKKCWDKEPTSRPTFRDIKDTVKKDYEKNYEINIDGAKEKIHKQLKSLKMAHDDSATTSNKDCSQQDELDAEMSPNVNKVVSPDQIGMSFRQMLLDISDDLNLNMLKVMFEDFVVSKNDLQRADYAMDVFDLLISAKRLQVQPVIDLTLLFETIKLIGKFDLKSNIDTFLNSCPNLRYSCPNLETLNFKTFSVYQRKVIKLGQMLYDEDCKIIGHLYRYPKHVNSDPWTLIMKLQRDLKIDTEAHMNDFIETLKRNKLVAVAKAVEDVR